MDHFVPGGWTIKPPTLFGRILLELARNRRDLVKQALDLENALYCLPLVLNSICRYADAAGLPEIHL